MLVIKYGTNGRIRLRHISGYRVSNNTDWDGIWIWCHLALVHLTISDSTHRDEAKKVVDGLDDGNHPGWHPGCPVFCIVDTGSCFCRGALFSLLRLLSVEQIDLKSCHLTSIRKENPIPSQVKFQDSYSNLFQSATHPKIKTKVRTKTTENTNKKKPIQR